MRASTLAMRDPAMAALTGAIGDDFGQEFEVDYTPVRSPGDDFGVDFGADYMSDEYGTDFGTTPLAGIAAPIPAPHYAGGGAMVPRPTPQALAALWYAHHATQARNLQRRRLMDPNEGLSVKIERYSFSLNSTITALGTAQANVNSSNQPDVRFRPEQFTVNVPAVGFVFISEVKMANVSISVGGSNVEDAFNFSPLSVGRQLSMPTLEPSNKASVFASYTGTVPSPLSGTGAYTLVWNFKGWARLAG